jgi:hypothetical protein
MEIRGEKQCRMYCGLSKTLLWGKEREKKEKGKLSKSCLGGSGDPPTTLRTSTSR